MFKFKIFKKNPIIFKLKWFQIVLDVIGRCLIDRIFEQFLRYVNAITFQKIFQEIFVNEGKKTRLNGQFKWGHSEISMSRTLYCFVFFQVLSWQKAIYNKNFLFFTHHRWMPISSALSSSTETGTEQPKTRQKRRIVSLLGDQHFV
jgi:hypothetical protein